MGKYQRICSINELKDNEGKVCEIDNKQIALFKIGNSVYAISNTCPHRGGPLGEGQLEGEIVECPWHGWKFNVKSGQSSIIPNIKVKYYPTKIVDNDILIEVEEEP